MQFCQEKRLRGQLLQSLLNSHIFPEEQQDLANLSLALHPWCLTEDNRYQEEILVQYVFLFVAVQEQRPGRP